jgi:hypothetical protein
MTTTTAGPYTLTDTKPLQFLASSWPSPDQTGWVVVYNFSTSLIQTSFDGDIDFLAPYVANVYNPNGHTFALSTETTGGIGEIYLVYYSNDEPEPSGFPMALYVAPEGTPQPVLSAVSITGPLPLPIEQGLLIVVDETPCKGMVTVGYAFCLHALGGAKPYTWALVAGSLPPGLALSAGGHVTGTPTATGGFTAVFECTDAAGDTDTEAFGFVVLPLPSKGIGEITSSDGSVIVTDPTGPITDLSSGGATALDYDANTFDDGGNPFTLSGAWSTFLTTASLAKGTWLLSVQADYYLNGTPAVEGAIHIVTDSATATFEGPTESGGGGVFTPQYDYILTITCLVHITVAGTLKLQATGNYRGQIASYLLGPVTSPLPHEWVTGYTVVRISKTP